MVAAPLGHGPTPSGYAAVRTTQRATPDASARGLRDTLTATLDAAGFPGAEARFLPHRGKQPCGLDGRPLTGWTVPDSWRPLTACAAAPGVDGLGIVLSGDGLAVLDLDGCLDDAGRPNAAAAALTARLATYTEVSPSGRGLHLWFRVAAGTTFRGTRPQLPDGQRGELYTGSRFVTLTGRRLPGTPAVIADRSDVLHELTPEWFPERHASTVGQAVPVSVLDAGDAELLERWRRFPVGGRAGGMGAVLDGDASLYGDDESRADYHAMRALAYLVGDDPDRIIRLYRQTLLSTLEKDGSARGDREDYVVRTAAAAIRDQPRRAAARPVAPTRSELTSCPEPAVIVAQASDVTVMVAPAHSAPELAQVISLEDYRSLREDRDRWRRRAELAETERDRLRDEHRGTLAVLRNTGLKQDRGTAVALVHHIADEQRRRPHPNAPEPGFVRIPVRQLAEASGSSPATIGRSFDRLQGMTTPDGAPIVTLRKERRRVSVTEETVNRQTGEIGREDREQPREEWWARLETGTSAAALLAFASATSTASGSGGKRDRIPRCPHHPDSDTVERPHYHCAECDELIATGRDRLHVHPDRAAEAEHVSSCNAADASISGPPELIPFQFADATEGQHRGVAFQTDTTPPARLRDRVMAPERPHPSPTRTVLANASQPPTPTYDELPPAPPEDEELPEIVRGLSPAAQAAYARQARRRAERRTA